MLRAAVRRFPALARLVVRAGLALPPSRLRTRVWRFALGEGFAASDRRDWEMTAAYLHPECEIDLSGAGGYGLGLDEHYRGVAGYVRWFESFTEGFSTWGTALDRVVAPAGNSIIGIADARAVGMGSGIEVGGGINIVFTYEGGWLVRIQLFAELDEALASVGLQRRPTASVS